LLQYRLDSHELKYVLPNIHLMPQLLSQHDSIQSLTFSSVPTLISRGIMD
jgi:hypothetical protein